MATYTDPTTIISPGKLDPVQPASLVMLVGGILSLLVAGGFFWQIHSTKAQSAVVQTEITKKQAELAALQPTADELKALSKQAQGLHTVFDTQKRWPSVLETFAKRLHKDLVVTSIQATNKGVVSVSGTVPDYTTYAKVFRAFTDTEGQKYFSAVRPVLVAKVVDADTGRNYVSFSFTLTLQPLVIDAGSLKQVIPAQ
ncbi:MAG TPA: hypothetical protein VLA04_02535 [Verrucomicrobiae bacterium]|nr:hypothetical protein [Verrucomicrobiae bacterium]